MEQAYSHFNSGKYKDAYNLLVSTNLNNDSYEPNLAICQYLSNRCLQTSINCHRKLNEWLLKKFKRENYKLDCQTESIVKFNISILLILLGKRDNALLVMTDIYKNRACFIEYMQSRIMLLLMELNIYLRNTTTALTIFKKYPLKPADSRNQSSQWVSLIMHEHNKSSIVCKQQFLFLSKILVNQALMQLSISEQFLSSRESDKQIKQQLVQRIKKRKNGINKYYEINIRMISHFYDAQKELHFNNSIRCLQLLGSNTIQNQIQQITTSTTKVITNLINALAISNTGIVHFTQKKYCIALQYFSKAKTILSKGITGVQDKDLQLFLVNYLSQNQAITYNIAMCLLASNSRQAYQICQNIKKTTPNVQNFKWWYRMGQSILQNYHSLDIKKTDPQKVNQLLEQAQQCFCCSLSLIDKNKFPGQALLKNIVPQITQQEIQLSHMKFKAEKRNFKRNIILILCYVYNCLGKYSNTIKLGTQILKQDLKKPQRLNILHYMMQAYIVLNKQKQNQEVFTALKSQTQSINEIHLNSIYTKQPYCQLRLTYEQILLYQTAIWYIKREKSQLAVSIIQNLRNKASLNPNPIIKVLLKYLHIQTGKEEKFIDPHLK